eukprot:928737-Pleurochrysis_carterae.AAC.1
MGETESVVEWGACKGQNRAREMKYPCDDARQMCCHFGDSNRPRGGRLHALGCARARAHERTSARERGRRRARERRRVRV